MDFLLPANDRSSFATSGAVEVDEQPAPIDTNERASVTNLITSLVIARAAAVRPINHDLADEYLKLACVGDLKPAVYATVLGLPS